jgi:cyclic pyranopterin phosphate synthase
MRGRVAVQTPIALRGGVLCCDMGGPMSPAAKRSTLTLTHVDARGAIHMVGVGAKPETERRAVAAAEVRMSPATLALVGDEKSKKGDVLATARLAGIAACKRTAELIPLCHPVRVVGTDVALTLDRALPGVRVTVTVDAVDRTGVEMEAMVGASVAALTIYDMVKGVERGVEIGGVRLLEKSGGRSGLWRRGVTKTSLDTIKGKTKKRL